VWDFNQVSGISRQVSAEVFHWAFSSDFLFLIADS
jgi:hypothetical protein